MIRIHFNEPDSQQWRKWRAECANKQEEHIQAIEAGHESKIDDSLYKGQKDQVYLSPEGPFHGKCAYCETNIFVDQYGDIDHFRPKSAVSDENGAPEMIEVDGEMRPHPGYYWLVYDWQNLLPSCILCNRGSSSHSAGLPIGKRTKFPVRGFRAQKRGQECGEEPLLLHPVFDDPEEHLEIDERGVFHARSDRGEACLNILGLNERDLPQARKEVYDETKDKVVMMLMFLSRGYAEGNELCNKLATLRSGAGKYTAAVRRAIKDALEGIGPALALKEV